MHLEAAIWESVYDVRGKSEAGIAGEVEKAEEQLSKCLWLQGHHEDINSSSKRDSCC